MIVRFRSIFVLLPSLRPVWVLIWHLKYLNQWMLYVDRTIQADERGFAMFENVRLISVSLGWHVGGCHFSRHRSTSHRQIVGLGLRPSDSRNCPPLVCRSWQEVGRLHFDTAYIMHCDKDRLTWAFTDLVRLTDVWVWQRWTARSLQAVKMGQWLLWTSSPTLKWES